MTSIERFNLSTGGTGIYRPGKWGLIKVSLRNPHDRDVELLATTHFVGDPTLQYARRLWMPARSRLVTWHPLRMPQRESPDQKFFDMRSMVLSTSGGAESMAANEVGSMQFDQGFLVAADEPATAMIFEGIQDRGPLWIEPPDFAQTARYDRGLRYNFAMLGDPLIPAGEELLDALDHLVVASDRILPDAAGIGAIRRWVAAGGRLWIMADRVSPALLRALLGDEATVTEVDRVELTSVHIQNGPWSIGDVTFDRDLEQPARFVRMIGDNLDVDFHVNGWPAAFWQTFGEGRILVTTLGGDGWVSPRRPSDPHSTAGAQFETGFIPSGPLTHLSQQFFAPRPPPLISREAAEQQVHQLIGYSIPGRWLIIGTLAGFTGLMAAGAVWLGRRGRLELMGWVVPALAVALSGVLIGAGWSSRSTIPASIAVLQTVQAVPGTDTYRTSGVAGIFARESQEYRLSGRAGGWTNPEMAGLEGSTRRLVWTDIDTWNWENLAAKPGLRTVPFQTAGDASHPIEAVAELGSGGISGRLSLPEGLQPEDAIIATSHGRLGVQIQSDGRFAAERVLSSGQYVSAGVLSDEQQRRSQLMSQALAPVAGVVHPPAPLLLLWTQPWEAGTSLVGPDTVGSALVSIPLRWERPAAGTSLVIPSPFLPFREVHGPDKLAPSGLYDLRIRKWIERTGAASGWLAFAVPGYLLPIEVTSATITFKVQGPLGRLELSTIVDQRRKSLKVWETPVGTVTHTIVEADALTLDSRGRLLVRVDVGRNGEPVDRIVTEGPDGTRRRLDEPASYWQFEEVSLQLSARIPEP